MILSKAPLLTMIWILIVFSFCIAKTVADDTSPNCRLTMKEPKGIITTPNFPDPYPVPINCQWVIEAPTDKVIAVYFTQFYMREGLKATEYAYYSPNVKMGKNEFGTISSEREPTYLVTNKPVLVLDFTVREIANIHMRVREYLLDVFGFNITYEFLSRNESMRKDDCLYHHCSFTGKCYASLGFDKYYCNCFSKYFGDECQYDSDCGPTASRNMCQNGGTCRYYIGSTVRTCECPPGYDGARCEAKKISTPTQSMVGCSGPSCNVTCPGGKTGISDVDCQQDEKRIRYVVSLKLTNPKVNTILSDRKKMDTFKKEMEHAKFQIFGGGRVMELDGISTDERTGFRIIRNGTLACRRYRDEILSPVVPYVAAIGDNFMLGRLEVIENITVLEVRPNSIMKFHVLAKEEDSEELKLTIEQMLELGKLGSFDFDHDFQEIYFEPALRIERVEASEVMPIAEGTELVLACIIQGSSEMRVEWLRDGFPIHIHTAERSMWTTIVPKNSQDQYTVLLGFDRVASLDTGVFTCQVSDFGFVRNRSIYVRVLSAPQPQLSPITATVPLGSSHVITCLSSEDIYRNFGYTWLKNGRVLNPSIEPEMAEDLFPTGSRILLHEASASATYSCIITSSAGSTRKDSYVTVIDKARSSPCCQPEDFLKVRWTLTASNTENIQSCPAGYTGDVRRKCLHDTKSNRAEWDDPDFSGCFSSGFLSLRKKVESLRLGYLISDTAALLARVKRYLMSKKPKLHFCEGEPIVDVLQDIQTITHGDRRNQEAWPTFLDIASALLESPILIKKHSKLLLLHDLIFNYGFQYVERTNEVSFEMFHRKVLAVQLGKIPEHMQQPLKIPSQRFSSDNKFAEPHPAQYTWMTNSVELDLTHLNLNEDDEDNSTASVIAVFYRNLSSHLPQRFYSKKGVADVEYHLISSLVAVRVRGEMEPENVNIKISLSSFNHTITDKHIGWNISCAMANFEHGMIEFTTNSCHLIWKAGNNSVCQCYKLGTYALLLTHYALPEELHAEVSFDAIAGTGVAICAFLLLVTILMLFSLWRKVRGAIIALKIQVCIALLGAFGIFFWGLVKPFSEEFFSYTVSLIQFFLLTAFSLQLCLALAVYIESVELKNVQYSFVKIAALGWAIPVIIVGATLAAQSLEGYILEGWWLTLGSNFFYAYTSSILILTMFQILLFLIVKTEIKNHGKVADFLQNKKIRVSNNRTKLLNRSLLLTTTLLLMSMASILYVNFEQKIYEYFFATSSVTVGLVVFLSYTFCSEKNFLLCCFQENHEQIEREDSDMRSGTDSFKSFLKPEIVDDPYSRKLHIDTEKRAERIKRMYSQIEKASLSDSLGSHRNEAAAELLGQRNYQHPESTVDETHTPIFKPYQHGGITNGSPHHLVAEGDAFCDPLERSDGYPKMHWRYASHPHVMYGSPGSLSKHPREQSGTASVKRPLLLETDAEPSRTGEINTAEYGTCSKFPSSFSSSSSSTFQTPQTVTADVVGNGASQCSAGYSESFNPLDNLEDGCSLRNSCFLQHTDSLETVVHCDTTAKSLSEAPLRNISRDTSSQPTQSWNMTTV